MEDIEDLLLEIEEEISEGRKSLFGSGVTIDGDRILSVCDRIRASYPDVIREARIIVATSEKRRNEETLRAQNMIAAAEKRANDLLKDHNIIEQATREAEAIRAQANEYRDNIMAAVKNDIGIIMKKTENTLSESLRIIRNAMERSEID